MKKLVLSLVILAGFAMKALAYDFQLGDLLYSINSTIPPTVRLVGHADGSMAQGELVIPETVTYEGISYAVTIIGENAFRGSEFLTGTLVIPNSIEEIHAGAFNDCSGFTGDLVIPNSVHKINIADGLQNTIPGTFENCMGFNGHLILSNSLEIIGDAQGGGCFSGCVNLIGELVIPGTTTYIGERAFQGCEGFTGSLVIPESVTEIGHYAFAGCSGIEDLVFPDIPFQIGSNLFNGCTGLTDVSLPKGWTTTGEYTFANCLGIQNIQLPESLLEIGRGAFSNCINLTNVVFPNELQIIGNNSFGNCKNISALCLPEHLVIISYDAFYHCTGIVGELIIPDSVEALPYGVFCSCVGITHLVLGKSLNYMSALAFENTNIETIMTKATVPPELDHLDIWHFSADIPIKVPCGTLEAYQNADGWSEYTNIHEGVTDLLSVLYFDETAGTVRILKEATCEDRTVEVEAIPNEGCAFMYWVANGERVSNENPYSFVLEEDTELVAYFSGTSVDEKEQLLIAYPNPTSGLVNITGHEFKAAEAFNAIGQRVVTATGEGERLTVDLNGLPTGVYFVNITKKDGRKCVRKIVKE